MHTTYLVESLDDGDVDELTSGGSGVGWELIVYGIDVGCVSEVGKRLWGFGGIDVFASR